MPFTTRGSKHVPETEPTLGPTSGFGENFFTSLKRQWSVESAVGFELDLHKDYMAELDKYAELTGEAALSGTQKRYLRKEDLEKLGTLLAEKKEQYPQLRTFEEIRRQRQEKAQQTIDLHESTGARASIPGVLGDLAGGFVGSLSPIRDPLYSVSLLFGAGAGRSVLSGALIEGAIGGTVEAGQQFTFVAPRYKRENLEGNNAFMNVLSAAVGGAALRGTFDLGGKAFRGIANRNERRKAQRDKVLSDILQDTPQPKTARVTNQELLDTIEDADLPLVRKDVEIAKTQLRVKIAEEAQSPHPRTRDGALDTEAEIENAAAELIGTEPSAPTKARVEEIEEIRSSDADTRAREIDPELFKRLDEATVEVDKIKEELAELREQKITDEDVRRAAGVTDDGLEELKARLTSLEERKAKAKNASAKAGIERAIKGVKKGIKTAEESGGKLSPQKKGAVKKKLKNEKAFEESALASSLSAAEGKVGGLTKQARKVRRKAAKELKKINEARPKESKSDPSPPIETINAAMELSEANQETFLNQLTPDENNDLDFGLDRPIDQDVLKVIVADEDGKLREISAREILDDLKEDKDMLQAVTTCSGVKPT